MSHTPGPWVVDSNGNYIDSATGIPVARLSATAQLDDNARLIAAAPDLLEACKAAVAVLGKEYYDQPFEWRPVYPKLKAAIAKAEGQEAWK